MDHKAVLPRIFWSILPIVNNKIDADE